MHSPPPARIYSRPRRAPEHAPAHPPPSARLAIVLAAAGLYAASLGGWVFLFVVFGSSACPAQQTLISLTLLFYLGLTALSCFKIARHPAHLRLGHRLLHLPLLLRPRLPPQGPVQ